MKYFIIGFFIVFFYGYSKLKTKNNLLENLKEYEKNLRDKYDFQRNDKNVFHFSNITNIFDTGIYNNFYINT